MPLHDQYNSRFLHHARKSTLVKLNDAHLSTTHAESAKVNRRPILEFKEITGEEAFFPGGQFISLIRRSIFHNRTLNENVNWPKLDQKLGKCF